MSLKHTKTVRNAIRSVVGNRSMWTNKYKNFRTVKVYANSYEYERLCKVIGFALRERGSETHSMKMINNSSYRKSFIVRLPND